MKIFNINSEICKHNKNKIFKVLREKWSNVILDPVKLPFRNERNKAFPNN